MESLKTPPIHSQHLAGQTARIAVAFSGGLDSTVLLHSTIAAHGSEHVIALHIHHGLLDVADAWVEHCARIAEEFDVAFDAHVVQWPIDKKYLNNIEERARSARYQALFRMCNKHGASHLLTAHHQDDQAETVLLQLLRGSGLPGLAGMPALREDLHIRLWRPFLDLTRSELVAYAHAYHLEWIDDPSNEDEQYTRNWLRKQLLPQIEKAQPQFRRNLSRSARHLAQAQHLLNVLADLDLATIKHIEGLNMRSLMALRQQDSARATNVLRHWLGQAGLSMPSEERLNAWWRDIENVRHATDHQISWLHDGYELKVWRQVLSMHPANTIKGYWFFEEAQLDNGEYGLATNIYEQAMRSGTIQERPRVGSEKIRIHEKRPRKTLKNIFQEHGIAPWQRDVPVLWLGQSVLAVVGIGINLDLATQTGPRLIPIWKVEQIEG